MISTDDTQSTTRLLAFSGGGFNSHSVLSGIFAGSLDRLEQLGGTGGLGLLMREIDGIGANSGGSWFLTHLAYSQIFQDQFDSRADRDQYTSTGYLGAVEDLVQNLSLINLTEYPWAQDILDSLAEWRAAVIQFLTDNFPEASLAAAQLLAEVGKTAGQLLQGFITATSKLIEEVEALLKILALGPSGSGLDHRVIVDELVYRPLGMNSELAASTLTAPRLAWAADKDFSIAVVLPTSDTILHSKPWLLGYDRMWSRANPSLAGAQGRVLAIDSVADASGALQGVVSLPGIPASLSFGNDQYFGPAPVTVDIAATLDAAGLGIIDATVASSSAVGLLAQPDVFGSIGWLLRAGAILGGVPLAAFAPFEANLAQLFRKTAPLASLANDMFAMPQVPDSFGDFGARYAEAVTERQVRLIDGAYVDNTAAAYILRQFQAEQGLTGRFDLTLFSTTGVSSDAGLRVSVDGTGALSGFRISRELALLFGVTAEPSTANDGRSLAGTLVDGPFPLLPDQMPSPQIFEASAWHDEGVAWAFESGDLSLKFFDLDVVTVDNPELGVTGGQQGRLRVFAVNNGTAKVFPLNTLDSHFQNYDLLRAVLADETGSLHLLSALGLLPLISYEGAQLNLIGGDVAATLIGRSGNDVLYGGADADTLNGRVGADRMAGGPGGDLYVLDDPADVIIEAQDHGVDTVRAWLSLTLGPNLENLVLRGTLAQYGSGNDLDNRIFGNEGNNVLSGGAGRDFLDGRAGADQLIGGAGDDVHVVDDLADEVIETSDGGTDLVRSAVSISLGGAVERLVLIGDAAIHGTGNALANRLRGNEAANSLAGEAGRDWLAGSAGDDSLRGCADTVTGGRGEFDILTGGTGLDTFVLGSASGVFYDDGLAHRAGRGDYALITDFTPGEDVLVLWGTRQDYYLDAASVGAGNGTALWWERGATDELLAVLRSTGEAALTGLNTLDPAYFV